MRDAPKRLDFLDLLKFVAISLVVICHCTTYNYDITESSTGATYFNYYFHAIFSAAVALFFFVNGYLLFNREFELKKHIRGIIRLVVITFLWGFINVLLMMLIDHQFLPFTRVLRMVWNWEQGWINQFWFMGVLVCLHIIFPVLKSAFDHNRSAFYFFVIVCAIMTFGNKLFCACLTIAAHELIGFPEEILNNAFNMFNPFRGAYFWFAFVYFCCGGIAPLAKSYIRTHQRKMNQAAITAIPVAIVLLASWGVYVTRLMGELWDTVWSGQDSVFAFVIVAAFFVLSLNYAPEDNWRKAFIRTVSVNTLGIYCIHEVYIHMILRSVQRIPLMQNIVGNIIIAALILFISILTAMILKRIPVVKKLLA